MVVYFRKLNKDDIPAILDISKDIWEGDDYVPLVIYEWLDDEKSLNYGAFIDSALKDLIGFGRVKILDNNLAWLEGGRVKKSYQKKGIGKEIMNYALDYINEIGVKTVQYDTSSRNEGSIALAKLFGFQRKKSMELLGCRSNEINKGELKSTIMKKISLSEAKKVYRNIDIGPGNEICIGWAFIPLKYLSKGNSTWFRNDTAIIQKINAHKRAFQEGPNKGETWLIVYGEPNDGFNLIQNILLQEDTKDSHHYYIFCHPNMVLNIRKIGFSYWDNEPLQVVLYEKKI